MNTKEQKSRGREKPMGLGLKPSPHHPLPPATARHVLQTSGGQSPMATGLALTLQAVPVGAGAGGRRGGLGSDDRCKCTLLFHGGDHVGW